MTLRIVVVGCGAAKRDRELEPGKLRLRRYPAQELYTSSYFSVKREYAEGVGDQWAILSAEHGIVFPWEQLEPYETVIDELDDEALGGWADDVIGALEEWVAWELSDGADRIVLELLAGQQYLEPIRSTLELGAEGDGDLDVRFPFDGTSGIGDQMQLLGDRVDQGGRA